MNNCGYRIAELRANANLTQGELAKILDVSQSYVGQWESNKRVVPTEKVIELAEYFNVTTDYILGKRTEGGNKTDLKEIIRNNTMTYNGNELSEHDLNVIDTFLSALLNKEN